MEEVKTSKQERQRARMDMLQRDKQNQDMKDVLANFEGRLEEVGDTMGPESNEVQRFKAKLDDRARREENIFVRAPLTKIEKNQMKYMEKSRNGLQGLTDDFNDVIKAYHWDTGRKCLACSLAVVVRRNSKSERYNGVEGLHTKVTEFVRDTDCLVCGPGILLELDSSITLQK